MREALLPIFSPMKMQSGISFRPWKMQAISQDKILFWLWMQQPPSGKVKRERAFTISPNQAGISRQKS